MGFRELTRAHNTLADNHNKLSEGVKALGEAHEDIRKVLVQLIDRHNGFFQRGFVGRLRWLFLGK